MNLLNDFVINLIYFVLECFFEQPDPRYWGLDFDPEHLMDGANVGIIRDHEFPIPKEHDKWLKKTYGDYMALPPKEKRVPMHVNVISKK